MKIRTFKKEKEFINETVKFIEKIYKKKKTGTTKIALSGGKTPIPIYKALSKQKFPFNKTDFFITDERYVPKNHKDSNQKMIFETLIKTAKPKSFHTFDTKLPIKKSLEKYEKEIKNSHAKNGFDLIILGIGVDGHIASIFPNSKALKETHRLTSHTTTTKFPIKDRLTLTLSPIIKSKNILVLLKGKKKKNYWKLFPAKKLLDHKNLTILFYSA